MLESVRACVSKKKRWKGEAGATVNKGKRKSKRKRSEEREQMLQKEKGSVRNSREDRVNEKITKCARIEGGREGGRLLYVPREKGEKSFLKGTMEGGREEGRGWTKEAERKLRKKVGTYVSVCLSLVNQANRRKM